MSLSTGVLNWPLSVTYGMIAKGEMRLEAADTEYKKFVW